jgi:hypothetical protein
MFTTKRRTSWSGGMKNRAATAAAFRTESVMNRLRLSQRVLNHLVDATPRISAS